MAEITYSDRRPNDPLSVVYRVHLEGAHVGTIRQAKAGGFFYKPVGARVTGDTLPTVNDVKASIEEA